MDIQIKYDNGQMNIHMDAFFPTSQARLKKLLKIVDLDFEHRNDIVQTMHQTEEFVLETLGNFRAKEVMKDVFQRLC